MSAPRNIDVYVGSQISTRRISLGLSKAHVSQALGISMNELQNYESGLERVSASRLSDLSNLLDVPIRFFFDDFRQQQKYTATTGPVDFAKEDAGWPETLALVEAFQHVIDPFVRERIIDLVKSLRSM